MSNPEEPSVAETNNDQKNHKSKPIRKKGLLAPVQEDANLENDSDQQETQEFKQYFMAKMHNRPASKSLAHSYISHSLSKLNGQIEEGQLSIPEERKQLQQLLLKKPHKKEDEKKEGLLHQKSLLQTKMKRLEGQINSIETQEEDPKTEKHKKKEGSKLTDEEHKKYIERVMADRKAKNDKKKMYFQKLAKELEAKKQKEQEEKLQRQKEEKQERRKKIEEKLAVEKELKEKKAKELQELNKRFEEALKVKPLYEAMDQKYQHDVLLPELEEKKKKLKKAREFCKAYEVDAVKEHQREYLRLREESLDKSRQKMSESKDPNPYKKYYKSERLIKLLESERLQSKLQSEEKKRQMEERINKQESFATEVREKFPPHIDAKKREQTILRAESENKKKNKVIIDQKILGLNYLQEAKNIRKRTSLRNTKTIDHMRNFSVQEKKQAKTNYLSLKRHDHEKVVRHNIESILSSSDLDTKDKIERLKIQAAIISEEATRKQKMAYYTHNDKARGQSLNLLLDSIKAKIGIIDIYKSIT